MAKRSSTNPNKKNNSVTEATKKNLAHLSGNKCANPNCHTNLFLQGISNSSIGEAAHIAGEKLGAARYDPGMTDSVRNCIDNLVYLCANCHTKVDGDKEGKQYSVSILHEWKKNHENKVSRLIDRGFEKLDFPELEEATAWLLSQIVPLTTTDNSFRSFGLISLQTKIIKHCLSSRSQHIISQACSRLKSVEEFIQEREKEDTVAPSFPDRLKAGILAQYYARINLGLINDELFLNMCEYMSGGFEDYATKSAAVSVLVYFLEKCDIFSE